MSRAFDPRVQKPKLDLFLTSRNLHFMLIHIFPKLEPAFFGYIAFWKPAKKGKTMQWLPSRKYNFYWPLQKLLHIFINILYYLIKKLYNVLHLSCSAGGLTNRITPFPDLQENIACLLQPAEAAASAKLEAGKGRRWLWIGFLIFEVYIFPHKDIYFLLL